MHLPIQWLSTEGGRKSTVIILKQLLPADFRRGRSARSARSEQDSGDVPPRHGLPVCVEGESGCALDEDAGMAVTTLYVPLLTVGPPSGAM